MSPVNGNKYRDKYPGIMQAERKVEEGRQTDDQTLEYLALNRISPSNSTSDLKRKRGKKSVRARGDRGHQENKAL